VEQVFPITERTRVRRLKDRGRYDRSTVYGILDEGLICHVGYVEGDSPRVIPTGYVRMGDNLYLHGSAASHMLRTAGRGAELCVTVTLLDGLVLARSAMHHSMNYRSVVIFGRARVVDDPEEKMKSLEAFVEHVIPGRWSEIRQPSPTEMKVTEVIALPLNEASAKVRTGPPIDDEDDYALNVWAGVIPLELDAKAPVKDARLDPSIRVPAYASSYTRSEQPGSSEDDQQPPAS